VDLDAAMRTFDGETVQVVDGDCKLTIATVFKPLAPRGDLYQGIVSASCGPCYSSMVVNLSNDITRDIKECSKALRIVVPECVEFKKAAMRGDSDFDCWSMLTEWACDREAKRHRNSELET